jgi:hypothetical protein
VVFLSSLPVYFTAASLQILSIRRSSTVIPLDIVQLATVSCVKWVCTHRHKLIFLLMYFQTVTFMNRDCEYVTSREDVVVACVSVVCTSVHLVTARYVFGLHCLQYFV